MRGQDDWECLGLDNSLEEIFLAQGVALEQAALGALERLFRFKGIETSRVQIDIDRNKGLVRIVGGFDAP